MQGIFGVLSQNRLERKPTNFIQTDTEKNFSGKLESENILLEWNVADKFRNDKCFGRDQKLMIMLDGVVLNKQTLFQKYGTENMFALLKKLYEKDNTLFFSKLRGNFCGCLIDLEFQKSILFTDHLGNKPLYYCQCDNKLVFSSSVKKIKEFYDAYTDVKLNINLIGAYSMVTYAYMYDNQTICEDIFRLLPGSYIEYGKDHFKVDEYYKLDFTEKPINEDTAIERIDQLFLEAVRQQVLKNEEYGYWNYAPLSAGLDSRMTVYALKRLGVKNVINFTYSETGELDQEIPMKIARDLGNRWIFKSLDAGLDMFDIKESIELGDSKIYYLWISQLNDFMKMINTEKMGIVHTGVIGDVVTGTFWKDHRQYEKDREYKIGDGAYSCTLIDELKQILNSKKYGSYEEGMYYNRAFNGACLGYSIVFQQYADCMSPFMNLDFIEFCLSLPMEFRLHHTIYYKWLRKFYPQAAKYSHNGLKITKGKGYIRIKNKQIYLDTIWSRILLKINGSNKKGMNPVQYWYDNNEDLKNRMDQYFEDKKQYLKPVPGLYEEVTKLYENGTAMEKSMCISLAGYIFTMWGEESVNSAY